MDLSIVIVNWNVRDLLERCLASLRENVRDLTFEVVVVDNASRDGSVEMVRERFPEVRVIANADNAGFCRGNNQGIEVTTGDYVCLLNPDTEVHPGAMERLVRYLHDHPDAGLVGPMLLTPAGDPTPTGSRFPTFRRELMLSIGWHLPSRQAFDRETHGREDFTVEAEVDVVCGACLMTRRRVLEQIGGLDESLFMFFDEVDFSLRAHRAGWRAAYVPDARVLHVWMGSVKQARRASVRRLYRARYVFFRKHHGLPAASALWAASHAAEATRDARGFAVRVRNRLLGRPAPPREA